MKQIILTTSLLSLIITGNLLAQDVIKFKNGDELKVEVKEITPKEIKYKRFDNLDGPLITILKNTATSIRYENGVVETIAEDAAPVQPTDNAYTSDTPGRFLPGDLVRAQHDDRVYEGKILKANQNDSRAFVELNMNGKVKRVYVPVVELTLIKANDSGNTGEELANGGNLYAKGQGDATRYYRGYHGAGTGTFLTAFLVGPIFGLIPAAACSSTTPKQDRLGVPNAMYTQNGSYMSGYTQQAHRIKSRKVWTNYGVGAVLSVAIAVALASSYR